MSKSNLNELCQKAGWGTPYYSCVKQGQDHSPLFKASVVVNGSTFHTSALFQSSKAAKDDVAAIAFSHYSTFSPNSNLLMSNFHSFVDEVPIAEMKNLKKLKLTAMGSCSNKDKGALKETAMEITPPDVAVPTTNGPDLKKSMESYLLCNKVRVYTSIPDAVLPKGSVVLPIAEGKWTIVSLE
ncbi:double-stranded RNA-binding protein 1-like protein [Tanacetum coccineum]